jgi:hypothetical protein
MALLLRRVAICGIPLAYLSNRVTYTVMVIRHYDLTSSWALVVSGG